MQKNKIKTITAIAATSILLNFAAYKSIKTIPPLPQFTVGEGRGEGRELSQKTYQVQRVIDGDTIVILSNNDQIKLRLIGINSPELARIGHPSEPFAL